MTYRRPLLAILAACATLIPACGPSPEAPPPKATPAPPKVVPETRAIEVVDSLGQKVSLPKPATRIVTLAPSNTEILFAIGAGGRVVGRTSVDTYPPEVNPIAQVGGMTPRTINMEAMVALRPDLVLATSGVQEPILEPIRRLGLTVAALDATDFDGVAKNVRTVGRLAGLEADADKVAGRFLDRVEAVKRRVAARSTPRPRVLYLLREEPPMTAGPATFIGQLIETAGGTNIFADVSARFPSPSEEEILARAPEIIVTSSGAMNAGLVDDDARRAHFRSRPGWANIPAVRDGRIALLQEDQLLRPGPRLVDGLEAMADALEPAPPRPK